jgi:hypothetical protein
MRAMVIVLGLTLSTGLALAQSRWTAPRTPDGHPDLQGVWANNTVTPFERPDELSGKEFLTDGELEMLKQRAARLFSGSGDIAVGDDLFLTLFRNPEEYKTASPTGDYNHFWMDDGLVFESRTSQIIDPPNGRLPPLTAEGERKIAAAARAVREHPADGPESRLPQERCLTFGTARIGFLQARNNSFHQIVQTGNVMLIYSEMIHEARIVPLDGRPHADNRLRFWDGDSRGRWEGSTLVIDTTNFLPKTPFTPKLGLWATGENVHLTERLTPVDAQTLRYEATVEDPTTWTRPWTAATTWKRSSEQMFEYACHEANYALTDMLRGARAEEAAAGASSAAPR